MGGRELPGRDQLPTALDLIQADTGELQRGALARHSLFAGVAVNLKTADAGGVLARQDLQCVARAHPPSHQRAGHDHSETLEKKGPVDGNPRRKLRIGRRLELIGELDEELAERLDTSARLARDGKDG